MPETTAATHPAIRQDHRRRVYEDPRIVIGHQKEAVDPDVMRLVQEDLEAFLGQPIEEIARQWWDQREETERQEHAALEHATDERAIHAFYAATDRYLYELGYWEAQRDKQREFTKLWLACQRFGVRRVLDFGGGVGGLSLFLVPRGIACDYHDLPGRTFECARFRFQRRGLTIPMWRTLEELPCAAYDAIVSYDVFEHLFDLEGACRRLAQSLRPGGWLITKSTFSGGGAHLEKNFKYADMRVYNAMLARCGLAYRGRLKPDWRSELLRGLGYRYTVLGIRISPLVKYGGNFLLHQTPTTA